MVPDSILERSRMSLISASRSVPEEWMVSAKRVCFGVRLPSAFSASMFARISRLFSGVRSSCDMFARNSDLYFEVRASCSAFSSSARLACSTSRFFRSTCRFCSASSSRFFLQLVVGLLQLLLLVLEQLFGSLQRRRLLFEPLVGRGQQLLLALQFFGQRLRLLQQFLRPHGGRDGVQHDTDTLGELIEERQVDVAEPVEGGQLDDGFDLAFEQHRQHDDAQRRRLAQPGADLDVIRRHVGEQDALLLQRALAHQTLRPACIRCPHGAAL